ncbi:MAG: ATP-binding protein, partial [Cyanobacteria bacterium P01_G01_bin.19]
MEVTAVIALVNQAVYAQTNRHLSDLQQATIAKVWEGKKYHEIADEYGCTEGHAKDTGSLLWKLLSKAWGKKVTKSNFRSLSKLQLESANKLNFFSEVIEQEGVAGAARKSFLGRKNAIATLQNLISQGCKVIVLQGEGGIGKTTLAQNFLEIQDFELTLEVLMAKETENIISVASVIEEWLQRDLGEDSGKEFGVTLARLKRYLEHHRVGILIDNLEPALDKDGKLVQEHRSYIELLRILADPKVKSTTIITSRDRFCEAEIDLEHYRLTGLDLAAWRQYFAACQIEGKARAVVKIHRIYGGNAKAMGIVCGILREDYEGDADRYWKENCHDPLAEADLKNLVVSQLDRLQNLDERAYLLLCRLGCYRYQDLTQIPQAGLFCLLWDVPRPRYRQVIKSLRNRSLLEFSQGKYWLHPMVRGEARARLYRSPQEWQKTHHQIADFITNSVDKINSIQDALIALEAYYHYIETSDYDLAAKVILHGRENQWGQFLTLGTTMYRLGIIQPLLTA